MDEKPGERAGTNGIGMIVMDKIERGYMKKYGEWVGKQQLQAPAK